MDCDQKMRPRARSQSHSPQRPLELSAVSTRRRTISWMTSASRARVDCQWNAKPRISTTKPVVVESVMVSAVSELHSVKAWVLGLTTATCPSGLLRLRTVAICGGAVRQQHFERGVGARPEGGERLIGAEHIDQQPSDRVMRGLCHHHGAFHVGNQQRAACAVSLDRGRDGVLRETRGLLSGFPRAGRRAVEAGGENVGEDFDFVSGGRERLAPVIEDLHAGAHRHGEEERYDQQRYRAAQRRLGDEKAPVCRFCDGLCQSLDRIRTRRRARNIGWRHRLAPIRKTDAIPALGRVSQEPTARIDDLSKRRRPAIGTGLRRAPVNRTGRSSNPCASKRLKMLGLPDSPPGRGMTGSRLASRRWNSSGITSIRSDRRSLSKSPRNPNSVKIIT